jgi:hypothetical protein
MPDGNDVSDAPPWCMRAGHKGTGHVQEDYQWDDNYLDNGCVFVVQAFVSDAAAGVDSDRSLGILSDD